MELAPFLFLILNWSKHDKVGGCQGFIGPLPSAFLDKCPDTIGSKRTAAKIGGMISNCQTFFQSFLKQTLLLLDSECK